MSPAVLSLRVMSCLQLSLPVSHSPNPLRSLSVRTVCLSLWMHFQPFPTLLCAWEANLSGLDQQPQVSQEVPPKGGEGRRAEGGESEGGRADLTPPLRALPLQRSSPGVPGTTRTLPLPPQAWRGPTVASLCDSPALLGFLEPRTLLYK